MGIGLADAALGVGQERHQVRVQIAGAHDGARDSAEHGGLAADRERLGVRREYVRHHLDDGRALRPADNAAGKIIITPPIQLKPVWMFIMYPCYFLDCF